jgi:hypothetical protein
VRVGVLVVVLVATMSVLDHSFLAIGTSTSLPRPFSPENTYSYSNNYKKRINKKQILPHLEKPHF